MASSAQSKAKPAIIPADGMSVAGGWLVCIGLLGVVITSALYALSPPQTVLPSGTPDLLQARALAAGGAPTIRAAGLIGIVGDLLFACGALVLHQRSRRVAAAIGWSLIALCGVIFIIVDSMACFALVPAAADAGAFAAIKLLFDALFLAGTIATGLGMILLFATRSAGEESLLASAGLLSGCACIAGTLACLTGLPAGPMVGLSIAASSLCGAILGYRVARSAGET